jgi:hypothetical protein
MQIRRFTGAGTGPGFLRGITIAGARNVGVRIEAMDTTTYPSLSPAAPGSIQAIQVLKSSDANIRWLLDQNGGMSWGPGNTAADVTLTRSAVGVLTVGGSLQDTGVWSAYTPTVTPSTSGTFTNVTATGRFRQAPGHVVHYQVTITMTDIGTGVGTVVYTIPVSTTRVHVAVGRENGVNGKMLQGITNNTTNMNVFYYDNTQVMANGLSLIINGTYEQT